jgi:RNA-splicing ligase RtcB
LRSRSAGQTPGGIVVHNCGTKAVQTELTRADLEDLGGAGAIMDRITRRISFGMGVPARERVDHPVLDRIRHAEFAPQRRLAGWRNPSWGRSAPATTAST